MLSIEWTTRSLSEKSMPDPSLKRSANGLPCLALISFWDKHVQPLSPA